MHSKIMRNYVKIISICNVKMSNDDNKYISSTLGKNSLRVPIIVHAEFEYLLVKIDLCEKNLNIS